MGRVTAVKPDLTNFPASEQTRELALNSDNVPWNHARFRATPGSRGRQAGDGTVMAVITVYFDGDQTLWDFQALMRRTLGSTVDELLARRPEVQGDLSVDAFVADRERVSTRLKGVTTNLEQVRLAAFRESLRRLGIADEALARYLNAFYLERRFAAVELYDDVLITLDALAQRYRIGLLSNGNSYPGRVGLDRYFEATVFSQNVGVEKPHQGIFAAAQQALPGDRYVMVGDSLDNDVAGAQRAGWTAVWLNRCQPSPISSVVPDLTITSLLQLEAVLHPLV